MAARLKGWLLDAPKLAARRRISASKRRRSSARSMASTVVPRMVTPWRSSGSARLIAVCPPNWTTTPLARSASMTARTAS